jgi:hypothetical protein
MMFQALSAEIHPYSTNEEEEEEEEEEETKKSWLNIGVVVPSFRLLLVLILMCYFWKGELRMKTAWTTLKNLTSYYLNSPQKHPRSFSKSFRSFFRRDLNNKT